MLRTEDLDRLVLVWLVVPRKSPTLKTLAKVVSPWIRNAGASAESVARQRLARLKTSGDIEADTTWMLSRTGKEKALSALGLPSLPKRPTWKWAESVLVARGLGAEPTPVALKRIGDAKKLPVEVLQRRLGIRGAATVTANQVGSAVAWRQLGVESTEPFSLRSVLTYIIQKKSPGTPPPRDLAAAVQMLAALELGVPRGNAALRAELVGLWMGGATLAESTSADAPRVESAKTTPNDGTPKNGTPVEAPTTEAPAAETAPAAKPAHAPQDPAALRAFVEQALAAVRSSPSGRWGDHKVFVSHVWNEFRRRAPESKLDLDAFKRMLVHANEAGLLSLSRADLVEVMDPEDIKSSEIASLGATFHFVRID